MQQSVGIRMSSKELTLLLVQVSMKDRSAFDLLYKLTNHKIYGVCVRILRNRAEAEDALQEVYVKIWTKSDQFNTSRQFPLAWMIAIARNHSIDRLRMLRRTFLEIDTALDVADPSPGPESISMVNEELDRINACLDRLGPDRAAAIRGAYLTGDSYAELAERHGVPLNTMRTWLRRSLLKLKESVEQ